MKKILAIKPIRTSWTDRLKADVQLFHAETGMKFTSLGRKSINDSRFWDRLVEGGTITVEKADMIYDYMATQGYHFNHEGALYHDQRETEA